MTLTLYPATRVAEVITLAPGPWGCRRRSSWAPRTRRYYIYIGDRWSFLCFKA